MSCRHRHGPGCYDHDDYYCYPARAYPGAADSPTDARRDRRPQVEDLEARLAELETELARVRQGLASRRREEADS